MKRILIVSATILEVEKLISKCSENTTHSYKLFESGTYDVLISGVGLMKTSTILNIHLSNNNYNFIINAGVVGAFERKLKLGEVVNVMQDRIGDLGLETENEFIDVFDMKLDERDIFPNSDSVMKNYSLINNKIVNSLKVRKGLSVSSLTSSKKKIQLRLKKYNANIESMEGAAIFYTCLLRKIPFISIKAISNYVGETDKNNWKLEDAINNLNDKVIEIINEIYV